MMKMIHCLVLSLLVGIVSQSVTADTGNSSQNQSDAVHSQQDTTSNEKSIERFVSYVLSLYDAHAEVEQLLSCLAEEGIEIQVPDAVIRTHEDFTRWYARFSEHFPSSTHTIEHLTVTVGEKGEYDIDVAVLWQAVNLHENPVELRMHQRWHVVDGAEKTGPRIHKIRFVEDEWYFSLPVIPTIEEFVQTSSTLSFTLRMQELLTVQQDLTFQNVGRSMVYFKGLVDEMYQFAAPLGVRDMLIYDKRHQLLTLYQSHETSDVRGVYLPSISADAFIPLQGKDKWLVTATSLEEIPRQELPPGIATLYEGEYPETTMMQYQTFGEQLILEFITPIHTIVETEGICIIHIAPQRLITR